MGEFSLLGRNVEELQNIDFFKDLNLDFLFREIFEHAPFSAGGLESYCRLMPQDLETVQYRQRIFQAFLEPETEQHFLHFLQEMNQVLECREYASHAEEDSAAHWHLQASYLYFLAIDNLMIFLQEKKISGMEDVLSYGEKMYETAGAKAAHDSAIQIYEKISHIRYSMYIEGDHIRILPEVIEQDILGEIRANMKGHMEMPERLPRLLPGSLSGTKLEVNIFDFLRKKYPDVFGELRQFAQQNKEPFDITILEFCKEISFYLSFLSFYHRMENYGDVFCFPEFSENEMKVKGGYDLSLAYKNHLERKTTVSNDYEMMGAERFFVVTGANQGGKTTFGRAAGQLIYFANMGFPVPASYARIPHFSGIVTHFSVEESMESGRGKLQEELTRLAPIMQGETEKVFVIINELFTSAATYDAYKMGRQVIQHFLSYQCYGIYITHIEELAKENDEIVSLVASLLPGSKSLRTYKILRQKAEGKGHVDAIVDQFGLSYEEIIRRLSNG